MKPSERPSLSEQYEVAAVTSNLGLPHGEGTGAQGILAAAAWTEVHLGSALRRLRIQWEAEKPRGSWDKTKEMALARLASLPRAERRRVPVPKLLGNLAAKHFRQYFATFRRLREWPAVHEELTLYAARAGVDDPVTVASKVLRQWLENQDGAPLPNGDEELLRAYLEVCHRNAVRALPEGMRGRTNNHPEGKV